MVGLICATILCMPTIPMNEIDVAIWKENGDHIFIIHSIEYNVGGECYNIEKEGEVHKYTWIDRSGVPVECIVGKIFAEINGELIQIEEY